MVIHVRVPPMIKKTIICKLFELDRNTWYNWGVALSVIVNVVGNEISSLSSTPWRGCLLFTSHLCPSDGFGLILFSAEHSLKMEEKAKYISRSLYRSTKNSRIRTLRLYPGTATHVSIFEQHVTLKNWIPMSINISLIYKQPNHSHQYVHLYSPIWFLWLLCFNGMSTFVGYLMPNLFLLWQCLTYNKEDSGFHNFS